MRLTIKVSSWRRSYVILHLETLMATIEQLDPRFQVPALRPPFDPAPRQIIREYIERVLSTAAAG